MTLIKLKRGLIAPVACPARGKSTLAKKLVTAGLNTDAVVNLDNIRTSLCPSFPCECPDANPECRAKEGCFCRSADVQDIMHGKIEQCIEEKIHYYVDGMNIAPRYYPGLLVPPKNAGLHTTALLFTVLPFKEIVRRNNARDRQVPLPDLEKHHNTHRGTKVEKLLEAGFDTVHVIDDNTEFSL